LFTRVALFVVVVVVVVVVDGGVTPRTDVPLPK
jgi:hypothetical protein